MGVFFIVAIASAIASAAFTSKLADAKGYEASGWAIAGLFFGPLALICAAGLPDTRIRRYIRALAEQQGVPTEALDPIETKKSFESFVRAGQTPQENFDAVSSLYKSEGGKDEPDFTRTQFLINKIVLKSSRSKILGEFIKRTDNNWYAISIY